MIWTPYGFRMQRRIPNETSSVKAEDVFRQTIQSSGLRPGVYRKPEEVDYEALAFVRTRLCEILEDEIARFESFDACTQLYRIHESFMARDEILTGQNAIGIQSVRSLIDLTVKLWNEAGAPLDHEGRDYLLALAFRVVSWDHCWDQFSSGLFKQEMAIEKDYEFMPQKLAERYHKAQQDYEKDIASRVRMIEISQDEGIVLPDGHLGPNTLSLWVKNSGFLELDNCLKSEVGYSLVDYFQFRNAVLSASLEIGPEIVRLERTQFVSECVDSLGIEESAICAIIRDFALSKETVRNVPSTKMFSTGRRNRDSRFMRRPIVSVDKDGHEILMFGIESLSKASDLFVRQVNSGRIPVSSWRKCPAVKQVFGKIQASKGDPFKEAIAKDCEKVAGIDHVKLEKDYINNVKSDPDLGAIDIFLVDNACQRFILAEVKNSGDRGVAPLPLLDERKEFFEDFLPTLRAKAEWFRSHIDELKKEFRVPAEKDYRVEEVIVVNLQRFWVRIHEDRLPILDDDEFLARLGAGKDLLSNPNGTGIESTSAPQL